MIKVEWPGGARLLSLGELQDLEAGLADVIGYLTDNSCCDPDCCGGPYYSGKDFDEGVAILKKYGIKYDAGR